MRLMGWLSPWVVKGAIANVKSETPVLMPFFPSTSQLHLVRNSMSAAAVTLLSNGELDTLALGQGDPGLVLANDENVALAGGEAVVNGVLDVDDVEATIVALTVGDDTNTTHVTTTSGHGDGTSVELDEVGDLAGGKVNLDSVVDLDGRVGVADAKRHFVSIRVHKGNIQPCDEARIVCGYWTRIDQSLIQRLNDV